MPGDRFDYSSERQRHERFVGRAGLLARLDQLLVDGDTDRWVVITGGPGMGKSALLAAWLARREAVGAVVPHHFIRRGAYDWDDPAKLVGSLVAQLEDWFPAQREVEGDERMHPATRLGRALSRVSESALRPRGERLVVLIDGLDEYDPPLGSPGGDPLAAFLPDALPAGVRLLCASRPRHPHVSSLEARDGKLVQIDLDDPSHAADNDATVRAFWEAAAIPLGLDVGFVDEAITRAGGNVQHAVQLRKRLDVLPAEQRRIEDIPRGLAALIEKAWARVAVDAIGVDGLAILCAARESLTLDEVAAVACWHGEAPRQTFMRAARELLVETLRPHGQPEYRLHHDSIRGYLARAIGDVALRARHHALAQRHATWPVPDRAERRRYALRYALIHRAEAGDWEDAWRLAADMSFMEAKCREIGAHEAETDVARMVEPCRASAAAVFSRRFGDLARALGRESHWLRAAPEATAALMWNRLRRLGWSVSELEDQLQIPVDASRSFLRVRHVATHDSPALVRELVGHTWRVAACAVTADSRRVVSASGDRTLKVWDLESGRTLATLVGHTGAVTACAVTADGRRVVSASWDCTLRVWDLESGRTLATLVGHTGAVTACAVTADGRRVVSASYDWTLKVWDLESKRVLSTLNGHPGWVLACTLTADDRYVISFSDDQMQKRNVEVRDDVRLWELEHGHSVAILRRDFERVHACATMPDGRCVIWGLSNGTLAIQDLETGRVLVTLVGHSGKVNACAVTQDGRSIVSALNDGTLQVWDLESKRVVATLVGHSEEVNACAVTRDGRRIVSASSDGTLKVWDLQVTRSVVPVDGRSGGITGCAVTENGRCAATGSGSTPKVWDIETGCGCSTAQGHADLVSACTVTPNGRYAVSASFDRTLKVWDVENARALATLAGHTRAVTACAVTADGRRAVSASSDQTLKVWDLENACALATLEGRARNTKVCAVMSDGRFISVAKHGELTAWNLKSERKLNIRTYNSTGCVVTSDGRAILMSRTENMRSDPGPADEDPGSNLEVWDLEAGRALATLRGHTGSVSASAVTPDGRHVVSASWDGTLMVWDLAGGRALATLRGHVGAVTACAVTADGRHVISASEDRMLKVWDLRTGACLLTHHGDAPYRAVAASQTAIVAGDRTGALWFLDWPESTRRPSTHQTSERRGNQGTSLAAYAIPPERLQTRKHTILFLAANPLGTDRLALDQEAQAIRAELERSGHRDQFELATRWAAQPLDLLRELRKLKPTVVHFCGHGGHSAPAKLHPRDVPRRDLVGDADSLDDALRHGLVFQGTDGRPQLVSTAALEETFGAAGSSVKLAVLNACYSQAQAEALLAHVDCVVGIGGSISDDAARSFAVGFYGGLGERESVAAAYRQGRAAISLEGLSNSERPQLRVRDGVDANQLVLVAERH